jgi:ABC-type multidrug transport system ATPase subunit
VVLGQSGSGKTTLLKALSGYTTKNISGSIRINDEENIQVIRKRSNFIMQNSTLHHFITVWEAMQFAANFKLHGVSKACKNIKVSCEN